MIKASVIIATYNMGYHLKKTIMSILSQTEHNFELIIIDDKSTDNTREIISQIKDSRIKYIYNVKNLGKSLSRNKGIKLSKSNYLFFTDADCVVDEKWIESGLKSFKESNCLGVEGKIYYVSKNYKSTYSDRVVENLYGGEYMTANIAYKKNAVLSVSQFDKKFERNQDRDLALRISKIGKIVFNPHMVVYHTSYKWTPYAYMSSASWIYYRVILFSKYYNERPNTFFRIYAPEKLLVILFPPFILFKLLFDRHKVKNDFVLFLLIYPRLILERIYLWKYALKEKVFII